MSVSVRCVRDHIFGTTRPIFNKFVVLIVMVVARSSSRCVGPLMIRYVFPVL